jgi:S1-C subfamily serine protease
MQIGRLVRETPPGRKVKVQVWRDGHPFMATLLTESPKLVMGQPGNLIPMPDLSIPDLPSAMLMWKSGILGIYCESVDSQLAEYFGVKQGVLVRFVIDGSAAQRAGLKAGDVLTKVGDRVVSSPRDVTVALHTQAYGSRPVSIVYTRDRKEASLKVLLEDVSPFFDKGTPSSTNH